jgi:DNA-binding XRE family transcriptional regulator
VTPPSDFPSEAEAIRSPAPSSTLRLQVARNLLLARSALRLTQDQVSEASGISRATIAQIEGAVADCRLSTINEIARALRICPLILLLRESDTANLLKHMVRSSVDDVLRHASPAKVRQMQQLKQTGLPRALVRVAQQGAEIARAAGYTNASSQVAAGIGSVHQPGTGTAVGTILGAMVDGQGVLRDAYDHGGGI